MPIEEFLARANRLRGAMAGAGLDALLVYGSGLNGCGHPTYISNYIVKLPFSALVVLPREGEPALMFEGATRGRSAAKATTWIEDVRPCWDMANTCLAVLAERKLTTASIGLAGLPRLVPHADWATLAAGLVHAKLVGAEDLVDDQRAIKSVREIAQVRRASEIVRRALDGLTSSNESLLAAHVMREARRQGAEDLRLMVARQVEGSWIFRPPEEAEIREGDTVALALSVSWERYWAHATQTFAASGNRLDPLWDDTADARFTRLIAGIKPGVSVRDWIASTAAALTPAEARALEPHGFGHGIGVTPVEAPTLSPGSRSAIASGMCLSVRMALSTERGIALRGETVIV